MSTAKHIPEIKSSQAIGPYNPVCGAGGLLFLSGQIPIHQGTLIEGGIAEQTRQVLENIDTLLKELGKSAVDVVKTTVFLADMGDFAAMNEQYAGYFTTQAPARSTIAVAGLPLGALVEIECIVV
jgi:2-iminobutanoate/2-iminopropanoate deaminase